LVPAYASEIQVLPVQEKPSRRIDPEGAEPQRLSQHVADDAPGADFDLGRVKIRIGPAIPEVRLLNHQRHRHLALAPGDQPHRSRPRLNRLTRRIDERDPNGHVGRVGLMIGEFDAGRHLGALGRDFLLFQENPG
jgi:hypothetical protein